MSNVSPPLHLGLAGKPKPKITLSGRTFPLSQENYVCNELAKQWDVFGKHKAFYVKHMVSADQSEEGSNKEKGVDEIIVAAMNLQCTQVLPPPPPPPFLPEPQQKDGSACERACARASLCASEREEKGGGVLRSRWCMRRMCVCCMLRRMCMLYAEDVCMLYVAEDVYAVC